jgi:hypothetical protein
VSPIASAYLRYVSTEATTALASIESTSMPTREILIQASMTIPLSRMLLTTSARLEDTGAAFSTGMFIYLLKLNNRNMFMSEWVNDILEVLAYAASSLSYEHVDFIE